MAFSVILIAVLLQYVFKLNARQWGMSWFNAYVVWLEKKMPIAIQENGWVANMMLILPGIVVVVLLASLIYHLAGTITYFVLNTFLVWFCLDVTPQTEADVEGKSLAMVLSLRFTKSFAILFWYVFLGVFGLAIYVFTAELKNQLKTRELDSALHTDMLQAVTTLKRILNWVPYQLSSLSFAVVGHFSTGLQHTLSGLPLGLDEIETHWQLACLLEIDGDVELSDPVSAELLNKINQLFANALWVWLVVIALFVIGGLLA